MKNNSSKISIKLLVVSILITSFSFGQKLEKTLPNLDEVFQKRDTNEDGKLEKSELIGFVSNDFSKLDSNSDSFLSKEELSKSSKFNKKQRRGRRGQGPGIDELILKMDFNEDGKLSLEETKGPLSKDFSKIDTNEDGFITKEELEKAPKPEREDNKPRRN